MSFPVFFSSIVLLLSPSLSPLPLTESALNLSAYSSCAAASLLDRVTTDTECTCPGNSSRNSRSTSACGEPPAARKAAAFVHATTSVLAT